MMRKFLHIPREDRHSDDVRWVYGLMHKYGSIEYARKGARQLAGAALHEFLVTYGELPDSEDKNLVHDIILYMIDREL
jgi:geranylgeranyl pyrophosphate synthase